MLGHFRRPHFLTQIMGTQLSITSNAARLIGAGEFSNR